MHIVINALMYDVLRVFVYLKMNAVVNPAKVILEDAGRAAEYTKPTN